MAFILLLGFIIIAGVFTILAFIAGIFRPQEPEETKEEQAERACALESIIRKIDTERL